MLFRSIAQAPVRVFTGGKSVDATVSYDTEHQTLAVSLPQIAVDTEITVDFSASIAPARNNIEKAVYRLLDRAQIEFDLKNQIHQTVQEQGTRALASLSAMDLEPPLFSALCEIITAQE